MALIQSIKKVPSLASIRYFSTSQFCLKPGIKDAASTFQSSKKNCLLPIVDYQVVSGQNSRLEDIRITADYLKRFSALSIQPLEQICPQRDLLKESYKAPANDKSKIVIFEINQKPALQDPTDVSLVIDEFIHKSRVECHRLLIIRKKKMRNHRRKRLWKKMWPIWRKKFSNKFKKTELTLRGMLSEKVNSAKSFNAENFVKDYLDDFHHELIPKTYQGGRKPTWFVKEMMEKDEREELRKNLNEKDLFTKEPLIKRNETVEEFIKRHQR